MNMFDCYIIIPKHYSLSKLPLKVNPDNPMTFENLKKEFQKNTNLASIIADLFVLDVKGS